MSQEPGEKRRAPAATPAYFGIAFAWTWTLWGTALVAMAAGPAVLGGAVAGLAAGAATLPAYGVGAVGGAIAVALLAGFAEAPGWRGVARGP